MKAVLQSALLALALLAPPGASADPNPQLLALIENSIGRYGLWVDVSQLSTRQAAALHLTMASGSDGHLETRRKLISILNWDEEDER